jgi:hypothetical protein
VNINIPKSDDIDRVLVNKRIDSFVVPPLSHLREIVRWRNLSNVKSDLTRRTKIRTPEQIDTDMGMLRDKLDKDGEVDINQYLKFIQLMGYDKYGDSPHDVARNQIVRNFDKYKQLGFRVHESSAAKFSRKARGL